MSRAIDAGPTLNKTRVTGLVGTTVVEPVKKFNRSNIYCVTCTDPFTRTRESQQKLFIFIYMHIIFITATLTLSRAMSVTLRGPNWALFPVGWGMRPGHMLFLRRRS